MVKPALRRWLIRLLNVLFFLLLFAEVGRTLGNPYDWVNPALADKVSTLIFGYGSVGGEEIDDTYFYIGLLSVIAITVVTYVVTMKILKRIRSK